MLNPKPSDVLSSVEVNAVIAELFYRLTPDNRCHLMAACPVAYAKLHGLTQDIVDATMREVRRAIDHERAKQEATP